MENLMAPYKPDLSDWDPSCRLSWWIWDDETYREILRAVLERVPHVHIHPELDPRTAAEEALLHAEHVADVEAFDEYLEDHAGEDSEYDPGSPHYGRDRIGDAVATEQPAREEELAHLRQIIVSIVERRGRPTGAG